MKRLCKAALILLMTCLGSVATAAEVGVTDTTITSACRRHSRDRTAPTDWK